MHHAGHFEPLGAAKAGLAAVALVRLRWTNQAPIERAGYGYGTGAAGDAELQFGTRDVVFDLLAGDPQAEQRKTD